MIGRIWQFRGRYRNHSARSLTWVVEEPNHKSWFKQEQWLYNVDDKWGYCPLLPPTFRPLFSPLPRRRGPSRGNLAHFRHCARSHWASVNLPGCQSFPDLIIPPMYNFPVLCSPKPAAANLESNNHTDILTSPCKNIPDLGKWKQASNFIEKVWDSAN